MASAGPDQFGALRKILAGAPLHHCQFNSHRNCMYVFKILFLLNHTKYKPKKPVIFKKNYINKALHKHIKEYSIYIQKKTVNMKTSDIKFGDQSTWCHCVTWTDGEIF